ncbi:MAG: glucose-1-phosphate cytidylyltransferase [Spirochaetaceae bacterium]|jgi:glucose-1-phosphate cytidylyltransferase|nr:glucose-1-phosphate cytidylyltransferase [Spirochaetaceae bacterium]
MKVVILAGGLGTRLSEETTLIPKPMVEIGGHPILWHIMKIYSYWGFNEFVILTGYKSHIIKEYFINFYTRYSDITVDMANNSVDIHNIRSEPWKVTMLYTGQDTMTGGRLLKAKNFIGNERFMLTYGDGVSDINIPVLLDFHAKTGKAVTLTSVQPTGKYGVLKIEDDNSVSSFLEKPAGDGAWISGGFFVMEPKIFNYITKGDVSILEREPLQELAADKELAAFKHKSFWKSMDTLKDKNELTDMWIRGKAPWALWLKQ